MMPSPSTAPLRPSVRPGANGRAHAVAGDDRGGRLLEREVIRHLPDAAAFVSDREEFRGGVVAGEADSIAFREATREVLSDLQHAAGGGVAGAERELPVRQVRVFEPLVRAGVDRKFGPGAHSGILGSNEDLIRCRVGQFDLPDTGLERFGNDSLTRADHLKPQGRAVMSEL